MLRTILDFFITQIFQTPAFFMGLVVWIGCIFLKKDAKATLVSVIKAIVGMLILGIGAGQLKIASETIIQIFTMRLGLTGVSTDMWTAVYAYIEELNVINMGNVAMVMIVAWVVNLLLARFTPIKTIFLTGHVAYCDSAFITFFLYKVCGFTGGTLFISAVLSCAIYWWLFPSILRRFLVPMLGDTPLTLGHNLCISGLITTQLARLFGKKEESAETLELSGWLSIFKDSVVAYSIIMSLIYIIIILIAGPEIVGTKAGGTNYIVYGLNQGLTMAVGVYVLLSGVRMFLNELIPAFKGFSDKLVPGAIAAVDSPVFWSYAPNAALLGFLCTVIGQFVGVGLLVLFGSPVIAIPSVIPLFFGGCTLGVFANAWGGWKGVIGATFIMGIVTICGSAALAYVVGTNYVPGHSDWSTLWLGIMIILRMLFGTRSLA
ncbi:MAG: PTS ascorbate transporter subunit IIC [Bacillota bacterium]|nr:PTS ascorbate transporter subunit IIC [Bacillota bacterium]HHU60367.1 PTS ascorbate transporter subunit IIC [Natronincola sp.]